MINEKTSAGRIAFYTISGMVVAFLLVIFFSSFTVIAPGEKGVLIRLGSIQRELNNGLHLVTPLIESVQKIDIQTQKEQIDATAASKDLQTVTTTVAINYNIIPDKVTLLWEKIGEDYKSRVIDPAIQESIKAATAQYTAEELITQRAKVTNDMLVALTEALEVNFIHISSVSIVNFSFSVEFEKAIEAKVTAEQDALAAKNKLNQVQFEADQRVAQAKAEAEAIKIQAQAVTQQGGKDYVMLQAIERWNGVLPSQMIPNATLPFIDLGK